MPGEREAFYLVIAQALSQFLQRGLSSLLGVKPFGLQVEQTFFYLRVLFVLGFGKRLDRPVPGGFRIDSSWCSVGDVFGL